MGTKIASKGKKVLRNSLSLKEYGDREITTGFYSKRQGKLAFAYTLKYIEVIVKLLQ